MSESVELISVWYAEFEQLNDAPTFHCIGPVRPDEELASTVLPKFDEHKPQFGRKKVTDDRWCKKNRCLGRRRKRDATRS